MVENVLTPPVGFDFDLFVEGADVAPSPIPIEVVANSTATPNRAPIVSPSFRFDGDEDTVITGSLDAIDPDGDPLTYSIKFQPFTGFVTVDQDGNLAFTPEQNQEVGSSPFIVVVDDNRGGVVEVVVQFGIISINDAPVAVGGEATGDEDFPISGILFGSDPDQFDRVTYSVETAPQHGSVSLDGSRFTYTPCLLYTSDAADE